MKVEDVRIGDELQQSDSGSYVVIGDPEQVGTGDGALVRFLVRYVDGGSSYRYFEPGQDVPLTRPES